MYLNILKKDLKRKKTMNLILFIFIVLASMFVSSSVNNIVAVTTALDGFIEKSGFNDYAVLTLNSGELPDVAGEMKKIEAIDECEIESFIFMSETDKLLYEDEPLKSSQIMLMPFGEAKLNYFDEKNNVIEGVRPGKILLTEKFIRRNSIQAGGTLKLTVGDVTQEFEISGGFKDAVLGSEGVSASRFILNTEDYEKIIAGEDVIKEKGGTLCCITTNDIPAAEKAISENQKISALFMADKDTLKIVYAMDAIVAGILLAVSFCLIVIAFVILQFTISFTLSEEFREIGVMKAIGVGSAKIRGLYMMKYFVLAAAGSCAGFFLSVPFGNMLIKSVSEIIVMKAENGVLINLVCSFSIVAVILLFCLFCTRKVKKFTPIDAIRNGTTGERFTKKGCLHLEKTPFRPSDFMALNDVLSNPKRFGIVIAVFALSLLLVLVLVITANTLRSAKLIPVLGMAESDLFISDVEKSDFWDDAWSKYSENSTEKLKEELEKTEKRLAENGMSAECFIETLERLTVTCKGSSCRVDVWKGVGTTADSYLYFEGTAPQNKNEAALTTVTAEKLGAEIGDTVTITHFDGERKYIVTALYQQLGNLGEGIRLHEDVESRFFGHGAVQIKFTDNPDNREIARRADRVKALSGAEEILNAAEYVDYLTGMSGIIDSLAQLVLAVASAIILLITVLTERSFIAKERGEIAILKAIGFKDGAIIKWHTLRFAVLAVTAVIIALACALPITQLTMGPLFKIVGADYGIKYEIVPLQVYVIYPLYILALTLISAFFAACGIRRINASESSNIE